MNNEIIDIAIVGAGAAGLMTAIGAGRLRQNWPDSPSKHSIFLFDCRNKIGAKILISGGTRCNVTNREVRPSDYQGAAHHYLKHVFEAFTPAETIRFFEEIGVALVLEPTGKYFPTTHSGRTVLEALLKELDRLQVSLVTDIKIKEIEKKDEYFGLKSENTTIRARRVVLATGGLSYPETGSDGTGLRIAERLGHTVKPTCPALTPLTTADADWQSLTGITVEAKLCFFSAGKKRAQSTGSFLFTHFGFSGPAALDLSRHFAASNAEGRQVEASFLPEQSEETVLKKLKSAAGSKQLVQNFLSEKFSLPARLSETLVKKAALGPEKSMKDMSPAGCSRLAQMLLHAPLGVTGVVGYKKAEVTAGGVDLRDVHVSTLESKRVPGLFFAWEILDVDGRIGGFNFQWAWSSGVVAGRGVMKSL